MIIWIVITCSACSGTGRSCDDDDIKHFDIKALELVGRNTNAGSALTFNSIEFDINATQVDYYADNGDQYNFLSFFLAEAHASCLMTSEEKIHSIAISVTPGFFSDPILSENMQLYFDVTQGFPLTEASGNNLSEIVKNGVYASREFSIRLNRAPLYTRVYQFTINYSHVDGESFELISEPYEIVGLND